MNGENYEPSNIQRASVWDRMFNLLVDPHLKYLLAGCGNSTGKLGIPWALIYMTSRSWKSLPGHILDCNGISYAAKITLESYLAVQLEYQLSWTLKVWSMKWHYGLTPLTEMIDSCQSCLFLPTASLGQVQTHYQCLSWTLWVKKHIWNLELCLLGSPCTQWKDSQNGCITQASRLRAIQASVLSWG